ncbi:MAG: hypothetical protein HYV93_05825 [Candidatus Rokubacteria bacterium]|nr:hypothetical protein [Candidatus Rokubacteria bacterium]
MTVRLVVPVVLLHLAAGCGAMAQGVSPAVIDPTVRTEIQRGSARVIVRLRLPAEFRPEGELPGPAAVAAQRSAIAAGQRAVLARLAGTRFTVARMYSTTPFLALEIRRDALAALEQMSDLVVRVSGDELAAPGGGAAPAGPSGQPR